MRFQVAKKFLDRVQELNALLASAVSDFLKTNTATHKFGLEDDLENFNFKNPASGNNENNLKGSSLRKRKCKDKSWRR